MKHRLPTISGIYKIALITILLFVPFAMHAQPGKSGPGTITSLNTIVNCYSAVTANVASGSTTVTTDGACTLECGDLVMIYQAQGASINSTNTDQYGTITNYNNSGLYEFNYVVSTGGATITVQNPWTNNYTATGKVQIIKVPQYTTLTVNAGASIVPSAWQESGAFRKGGIVAIHATGTVIVNGSIQANACSFRSGVVEQNTSNSGGPIVTDFVTPSSSVSAEKGESIAGFGPEYDAMNGRYGRGSAANGGGGGNGHNAGGGGGSNGNNGNAYNGQGIMCTGCAGAIAWSLDPFVIANAGQLTNSSGGGRGGYTYGANNQDATILGPSQNNWGGDKRNPVGGHGGHPLTIAPATRIFFGGGGGIGDSNNSGNQPGGKGGGIVYIIAPTITGVGGILANGGNALNQISTNTGGGNDAPSGGGGGGTIILKSTVSNALTLSATGGKGGDQGFLTGESEGPGGGGGGGYIAIASGTPTINFQGGDNGITLSSSLTEFLPNGSTQGAAGQSATLPAGFITFIPVEVTATVTTPVCVGNPVNFTSTVNYPGGTFAWSGPGGFSSAVQNPVIASAALAHNGQSQVIYTTPGGCKDTAFVMLVVNPTPVVTTTATNPLCNGACNGSAAINFTTNGTPGYTFTWNNGQTTQTASNLCAGTYTATIVDINNCSTTASATITNPVALSATAVVVNALCNGSCNGAITLTATGGASPYQYSLNGGAYQAAASFTGLCAGSHVVTVKDANNCTFTVNSTVTQPNVLAVTLVSTAPATCGSNSGAVTVSGSGGTIPYSYSIGGAGQAGGTFSGLAAGSYTVTITDAHNCTSTVTAVVTAANAPIASVLSQQNVTCFGGVNGSVLIGVAGGTNPIHYSLNGGASQLSNNFTSLNVGNYTVTITDANNCSSVVNFTITSPTQLSYTSTPSPASCNGVCDGSVLITATGGTAPYGFSANNGTTFSTTNPVTGLCAGAVNLVVEDANGCLANSVATITQPTPVTATFVNTDPICNNSCDGQVTVTAAGGTPAYQYAANGGAFQSSPVLTGLCAGNQQILVKDSHGCQLTATRNLVNPPGFALTQTSMTESNCGFNNGSLEVTATGLHPSYQYSKNGEPNQPTGVFTNLTAGAYQITATDALGCQETVFFGINDIEMDGILLSQTDVSCYDGTDATVEVTNVSGAPPITYELDNNGATQTNGTFFNLPEGSHIIIIYDNGNCIYTLPFIIIQPEPITFNTTVTDNLCNAGTVGAIDFSGTAGGIGAYYYSIDNGATFQPAASFSGLAAGTYDLAVMDDNSCIFNGVATITEPTPVLFQQNTADLTCNGNSTGSIQLVGSGGTGSYTYSIDNAATFTAPGDFFGIAAGNYDVVIRDVNLCEATGTIVISEPAAVSATYASTPVLCNSSCDGQITITAAGGTGAYQYSTDNGTTFGITPVIGSLCSGTFQIVVRDVNLCSATGTESIAAPTPLTVTNTTVPSTCGQSNGEIQLTAGGGVGNYTYSNDNGATFGTASTFTAIPAGSYNLVVHDGNACEITAIAVIADQSSPLITGVFVTDPLCNASCDGEISITTSGGMGPLSFSIGGTAQPDSLFTAICAGNYTITLTDQNGCTDNATTVVNEPAVLSFTSSATNLTCFQDATGAVQIVVQGGTIPYNYSYDNGVTFTAAASTNFIQSGTYDLVVTDDHACQATGQQIVTEPALLTASVSFTDATCATFCDGTATAAVAGGTGTYTYDWSANVPTSNQDQASALCMGSYSLLVTDINGCSAADTFDISEPAPFVINGVTWTEPSCTGLCDGTITVDAPGGSNFSFDGGATTGASNTLASVCTGIYNIEVTNPAGCFAAGVAVVDEPLPLQLFSTPDSLMCSGDTVPLFAIAFGGTEPFTYTWDNGIIAQTQDVHPLTPTVYNVFVTDDNGCQSPAIATSLNMLNVLQISVTSDTLLCEGNSVDLAVQVLDGYPGYEYQWSSAADDTLSTVTVTPFAPTTYTISVTDQCGTIDSTVFVGFYTIPDMTFSSDFQSGCSPLTVTFTPDIDPALLGNCNWEFSDGQTVTDCNNITATFTDPGCYDVIYTGTTSDGCPMSGSFNDVVCVFADPVANFSFNPTNPTIFENTIHFTDDSYGAVSYEWNFGPYPGSTVPNPIVNFNGVGVNEIITACLEITSEQGCKNEICKPIKFLNDFVIYVPNTFTPDGDAYNNVFYPVMPDGSVISNYTFIIFDRWGEIIFESLNYQIGWDGTYHDKLVQDGVYTWVITLTDGIRNKPLNYNGHVTLLR